MNETNDRPDELLRSLLIGWSDRMRERPDMPIREMREMREAWHTVTTEPTDVCYEETVSGDRRALWCSPLGVPRDRVLLFFHAGAFVAGSLATHRKFGGHLAKAVGARTLLIDYRLAPEHVYPAQLDDAVNAYHWLLGNGYHPENIACCGDSAGGTLALALPLKLRDIGTSQPAVVLAISPGLDWECEFMDANKGNDVSLTAAGVSRLVQLFIGETRIDDPLLSPQYGDLAGMPPVYLVMGGYENLLGGALRYAEKARQAGVDLTLDVGHERQHIYTIAAGNDPEADATIARFAEWSRARLGLQGERVECL
ncbi:acetyl esterase/lipase [Paraburkholderia sp. HC6.4b]|uniref:alpha/beta hydrolase n=1 Tax=unclassified Paraburkholderia TaxID=2615204 RepID=UPI00161C30F6|nr:MULTISPECIES: alpha/beta hydrolase [unclassified Paraburkholderia]MBB5406299.1 acetyl esterase/lipase [Paraburkholderia sp. HC6.4b]MBB5448696.1 acetyl esterase/lipase [Paraburkholderia sp. Kb1A]